MIKIIYKWIVYFIETMLLLGGVIFYSLMFPMMFCTPDNHRIITNELAEDAVKTMAIIFYGLLFLLLLISVTVASIRTFLYVKAEKEFCEVERIINIQNTSMGIAKCIEKPENEGGLKNEN